VSSGEFLPLLLRPTELAPGSLCQLVVSFGPLNSSGGRRVWKRGSWGMARSQSLGRASAKNAEHEPLYAGFVRHGVRNEISQHVVALERGTSRQMLK
jgi:hypothetical protein